MVVAFLLAACTGGGVEGKSSDPTPSGGSVLSAEPPTRPPAPCPVTLPNGDKPPGQTSGLSHGNGRIWLAMYPRGVIRASREDVRPNGDLAIKFPWTRGVEGHLTITGRRLDAQASPLRAWIPGGYGHNGFQSSAVIFPTTGCWQVTGSVGDVSLTVVVRVKGPASRNERSKA